MIEFWQCDYIQGIIDCAATSDAWTILLTVLLGISPFILYFIFRAMAAPLSHQNSFPGGTNWNAGQQLIQSQNNPSSKLELHISCRGLLDMDTFSKSDPIGVVSMMTQSAKEWREIGRTEAIDNTLNPDFATAIIVDYFFEEIQKLKFDIYDIDSKSQNMKDHDFIGSMECNLSSIVGEGNGKYTAKLRNPKHRDCGSIIVTVEEISSCKDIVSMKLCGKKLDKKDWFGKSDPFLVFSRCNEDNSYTVVFKTDVIMNTLNPNWQALKIPARILCNGDYDRAIKIQCFDWNKNGSHDLIGEFTTDLAQFRDYKMGPSYFDLIHPKYQAKKKKYKNSGTIHILECNITQQASFLDYIQNGTELNFVVAIDFTASNGNPSQPGTLHHSTQYQPSQYVQALTAVGNIIEDYDTDKLFPAFGFGAKVPPSFNVAHQFTLSGLPDPNCQRVSGIIAAYYQAVQNVQLYGPTNFAPVINSTSSIAMQAARSHPGSQYFVLLIVTDGIITDMEKTKEAIVNAAALPMSIIIVGVGNAEFDAMEELDGDVVRVSYRGKQAERDIVQFVPFRDFVGRDGQYTEMSGARLAKEVLQELPDQLLEYMTKRGIKPMLR